MKRIRLDRWANQLQPPRNPRLHLPIPQCTAPYSTNTRALLPRRHLQQRQYQVQHQWQCQRRWIASRRKASSAAALQVEDVDEMNDVLSEPPVQEELRLNAPSHRKALKSAKLAALHARLSLPSKLPLQTLAKCLIDPSVDPRPGYNNEPFSIIGQDLLGYYTAEWLLCHYPRLPMPILFAAQYAYVGSQTLAAMRAEWGVEVVAAPGPEVDAGLLQLKRMEAGNAMAEDEMSRLKDQQTPAQKVGTGRRNEEWNYRRGQSSRIVYDDQFGDLNYGLPPSDAKPYPGAPISTPGESDLNPIEGISDISTRSSQPITPAETNPTTVEEASARFIRALTGALYLHTGTASTKSFHQAHILSRHLPLHNLFNFTHPTRDLSKLCAREGFEPPVARLISETGRHSRSPVFVVGVYSGDEKLGEGAGSSLNEGRVRAAAAALRSWYLYSPPESEVMVPSDIEGVAGASETAGASEGTGKSGKASVKKAWKPQVIDIGEIVT